MLDSVANAVEDGVGDGSGLDLLGVTVGVGVGDLTGVDVLVGVLVMDGVGVFVTICTKEPLKEGLFNTEVLVGVLVGVTARVRVGVAVLVGVGVGVLVTNTTLPAARV